MTLAELKESIQNSLEKLTTLETVTLIGAPSFDQKQGWGWQQAAGGEVVGMLTKKRLLDGDITTVIHPEFVSGQYAALREFHLDREAQGAKVISDNLAALKALFEWVSELVRAEQNRGQGSNPG